MKFMCLFTREGAMRGLFIPMDIRKLCRTALAIVSLVLITGQSMVQAEGDAQAGSKKAHTCLGCHGVKHYVNTYPSYHVPRIAGQHQAYLEAALQAYRDKTRSHPTMQANANLLTDQDIQDIAAWFASLGATSK